MSTLAMKGGTPRFTQEEWGWDNPAICWPVYTREDEEAVLQVMRQRLMSGSEITKEFEKAYAQFVGTDYALGYCNGTASLQAAMWACGVGAGDEIIAPTLTYWASAAPALMLGATVNFADVDPQTLCIDPNDIEHRIGPRTKAIVVVHYTGYPAEMDKINAIASRHGIAVIEDASHSHGAHYHGKMTGSLGDVAGQSMMTGKAFAIGEAGMLMTNRRELWERAISFGHYERTGVASRFNSSASYLTDPELVHFSGVPIGGRKDRMNQWCSALGLVQLRYFPERLEETRRAMDYVYDELEKIPGIRAHRPAKGSGSDKGGQYTPLCHYVPEEVDNFPVSKLVEALNAENVPVGPLPTRLLHIHPVFNEADIFRQGKPTAIAFGQRDVRQKEGDLPVAESKAARTFRIPKFVRLEKPFIDRFVETVRDVILNRNELKG